MADDIQSPTLPDVPFVDDSADAFPSFRGHNQGAELLSQAIAARDLQGTEHYLKAMADKGFEAKAAEAVVAAFAGRANPAAWQESGSDAIFPVKLIKALTKVPAIEAEVQKSPQVLLRALEEKKWGLGQLLLNRGYGPGAQVEKFMRLCLKEDKPVLIEKFDALYPGETAKAVNTPEGARLLTTAARGELGARYLLDTHYPDARVDQSVLKDVATYNVTALRLLHERGHVLPAADRALAATMPYAGLFETLGSAENQAFFKEHILPPLARRTAIDADDARIVVGHACRNGSPPSVLRMLFNAGLPLPDGQLVNQALAERREFEAKRELLSFLKDEGLELPTSLEWRPSDVNAAAPPMRLSNNTLALLAEYGTDGRGSYDGLAEQLAVVRDSDAKVARDQLAKLGINPDWDQWNLARAVAQSDRLVPGSAAHEALHGSGPHAARVFDTWQGLTAAEQLLVTKTPHHQELSRVKGWRAEIDGQPAILKLAMAQADRTFTGQEGDATAGKRQLINLIQASAQLQSGHGIDTGVLGSTADGKGLWQTLFEQNAARAPSDVGQVFSAVRTNLRADAIGQKLFAEVSPEGDTLVHMASKHGLLMPLRLYLSEQGVRAFAVPHLDTANAEGKTPLDVAKSSHERDMLTRFASEVEAQRERERAAAAERERQEREKLVAHLAGVSESGRTVAVRFTYHDMSGSERDATTAAAAILRWSVTPEGVAKVASAPIARADDASDAQHRARVIAAAQRLVDTKAKEVFANERERLVKEMDKPAVERKGPAKASPAR